MYIGDKYKHKKTGDIYVQVGSAICCTNGEHVGEHEIIYRKYREDNLLFSRLASEFYEKFELVYIK
jgi:hypothetical protein